MGLIQHNVNWVVSQQSMLQDCKSEKQLYDKIIFIETQSLNRPHLNLQTAHIYRLKQAPYESFFKTQRVTIFLLTKTFQQQSPKLIEFSTTLTKLSQAISHKNLAPVQFIKINEQNNMCMRTVRIDYYATYYGIELRDVIENRKSQDCRFEQGEILYVAKSLINFGAYLQSHKIAFGMYKSKNIFMSDNGYVKMYLFHMLPQNKHINYFNLLSSPRVSNLSLNLPIAPQTFQDLQQNNLTPSFDYYKADMFQIGMTLVDMMVENSLQRYYRFGKEGMFFDEQKLQKDLQQLKQKEVYHLKIISFLQNILETDPQKRWNFQQADKFLDELKKQCEFAYRLTLRNQPQQIQDSQNLKNKLSFKSQEPESQYVLRSIQNSLQSKLNPLPLKSLSKNSTKHATQQPNYFHKTQFPSKQTSTQKSIYTKRRNTGVSIISSSSQQNDRSFSRRDNKSSKFSTVRNSRVYQQAIRSQKNQKQELTDFADKMSCISSNVNLNQIQGYKLKQKSENWLTLGSTRITQENSRAFNLLPPKSSKSLRPNHKIHLHHNIKQNSQISTKRQQISGSNSTHIKVLKKMTMSPRSKQSQLKISIMEQKQEWKENIPNWKQQKETSQKSLVPVRPKLKINHLFRA